MFSALAGISAVGTVVLAATQNSGSGGSAAIDRPYLFDPALGLAVVGVIFSVIFIIPVITHSRKKLQLILDNYKAGKNVPKKYRKKLSGT